MDKPTKALILGVAVGALVAGVGLTNSHRLERKVQELQTRCVADQIIWDDDVPKEKGAKTPGEGGQVDWFAQNAPAEQEKEAKTPGGSSTGDVDAFDVDAFMEQRERARRAMLLCDPIELGRSNGDLVDTQEELAAVQRQLWQWKRWPISGGLAITVFFALPWVWYFLLRRIRELREALIGK